MQGWGSNHMKVGFLWDGTDIGLAVLHNSGLARKSGHRMQGWGGNNTEVGFLWGGVGLDLVALTRWPCCPGLTFEAGHRFGSELCTQDAGLECNSV